MRYNFSQKRTKQHLIARTPQFFLFAYFIGVLFQPYLAAAESAFVKDNKVCVSGDSRDCFTSTYILAPGELNLVGATFFSWLLFDVYSAALYGTDRLATEKTFDGSDSIALEIRYRRSFKRGEMIDAADKILNAQGAPLDLLRAGLTKINLAYKDVNDGDTYTLVYTPDNLGETSLLLNGELLTTIPGKDFAVYYFNIWLAEKDPFDTKVRESLVNLKCPRPLLACI